MLLAAWDLLTLPVRAFARGFAEGLRPAADHAPALAVAPEPPALDRWFSPPHPLEVRFPEDAREDAAERLLRACEAHPGPVPVVVLCGEGTFRLDGGVSGDRECLLALALAVHGGARRAA